MKALLVLLALAGCARTPLSAPVAVPIVATWWCFAVDVRFAGGRQVGRVCLESRAACAAAASAAVTYGGMAGIDRVDSCATKPPY